MAKQTAKQTAKQVEGDKQITIQSEASHEANRAKQCTATSTHETKKISHFSQKYCLLASMMQKKMTFALAFRWRLT